MATDHPDIDLVPYLRGELSADAYGAVERHLKECAQCRESLDASTAILARVARAVDELPAPDWTGYRAELRRKLAARETGGRDIGRRLRLAGWSWPIFGWPSVSIAMGAAFALLMVARVMHRGAEMGAPGVDQLAMESELNGADIKLLVNYRVVEHLDLLENYDVIEHLDEIAPGDLQNHETRS